MEDMFHKELGSLQDGGKFPWGKELASFRKIHFESKDCVHDFQRLKSGDKINGNVGPRAFWDEKWLKKTS